MSAAGRRPGVVRVAPGVKRDGRAPRRCGEVAGFAFELVPNILRRGRPSRIGVIPGHDP
jgi:hypothetical protein